ncbi:aspartic proteinase NANA, chloroplast-like [Phragmites australis]|uniref:aspartic proteinase NANA, chloroplast-like n=1 Tax=Phragmites australis TaxID=29695 RepID=UPI002D77BD39|nr:aspartic proteinase NANA, chloroplast-like [Phragmites australis]
MALRGHLLVVLVLLALAVAAVASGERHRHRHRHRGKSARARLQLVPAAPGASLAVRARDDRHRHAYISAKLSRRRAAEVGASAFDMPLSSGAYTGTGQYFVRFRVGTPAQPFVLVADTGSDLTWVKCRGATPPPPSDAPAREFRSADSKSWAPIPCSSDMCTSYVPFSLANCSSPANPCSYDYRYKDGSAARGVVGTDSATIALSGDNRRTKLQGVVLGCTTSYNGRSFQSSDGVLSLGNSNISFATRAAARFGGRFSYCLVDHLAPRNATSYLTFGPAPEDAAAAPAQTPLLLDRRMNPFYAVTVDAIHVAGEKLDIPADVWDVEKNGGAILDSGTTLTILATPAYKAVVAALSEQLAGLPRVSMDPFEYCYNWTAGAPDIPKLEVQFAGSALLEPPAKSYVIDAAPGVKCIGVQEGAWPGVSVIGNILQQEHLWEFDLRGRWLRFKHTSCTQ